MLARLRLATSSWDPRLFSLFGTWYMRTQRGHVQLAVGTYKHQVKETRHMEPFRVQVGLSGA